MGDYMLTLCYKRGEEPAMEKELHEVAMHPASLMDERYGVDQSEVMWRKGLRYLSTIVATAFDLQYTKREGIKEIFEELKQKVKVWIRAGCAWDRDNYIVTRVFWPCEILDLKEVQDEVKMLTSGFSLSKENPEDVEMVQQSMRRFWKEKKMPTEELISNIESLDACIKKLGTLLTMATEIHHKYPEKKFWFYVEFD
ncbi:MAG: hypothetical protein QXF52_04580 [Thermoproteota archaeon]